TTQEKKIYYIVHFNTISGTYDHRVWKTGLPVRSAVLKPHAGQLVRDRKIYGVTDESFVIPCLGTSPDIVSFGSKLETTVKHFLTYHQLPARPTADEVGGMMGTRTSTTASVDQHMDEHHW
ncbi:L-lysine 2-3-aminomutase, partial [Penicillium verhagenii]